MKKNVAIIIGHPNSQSFCSALATAYKKGAEKSSADVRLIDLSKISFDPNLKFGYSTGTELEQDLKAAQDSIRWADHLVFVYPYWWGSMPAVLKGFVDRVFLPGFAFKYRENSPMWDKLLTGKSAHLIVTMDTPSWYNRLVYKNAGLNVMKRNILQFCGVKPVRITKIGPVRPSSANKRASWLAQVENFGAKLM
jgi:putative NADPH-quinone reductase